MYKRKTVDVWYFEDWGKRKRRVWLGSEITPLVEDVFSSGQCHALAVAIHELTGWPLFGCYNSYGGSKRTGHVIALRPDGLQIDVKGTRCSDYGMRRTTAESILRHRNKPDWLEPNMVLARHFAPLVLERVKEQDEKWKGRGKAA